ncbi:MAG: FAD-dependent oxidoreductase [Firmicutes bacterium CAG:65_45_313]|nr:MAG: FAD-dependent oxidoreductase [Firmicutes bacterium CAG:65_45_313]
MSEKKKVKNAEYDVVVIGGGMSGICAALAAARHGARTALVHDRHVLGGNASSEIRMHICGASENLAKPDLEESGILHEIMLDNKSRNDYYNFSIWDMVLFSTVKRQKNLTVYLSTAMESCEMGEGSTIRSIDAYQLTTETHWKISGKVFIDCTGNATLGYYAEAEFRTGSEGRDEFGEPDAHGQPNKERMGNTLLFKAVDRGHPVAFKKPDFARTFTEEELKYRTHSAVHGAQIKGEVDKAYVRMTSFSTSSVDYGYWWIELPGETDDIIDEYEQIRDELVSCIYGIWDHLKNGGDHGAENYDLEWVGMLPGSREGRRLIGDYILNENDILSNRQFEDAVAYGGWPMDIHTAKGLYDFDELPSRVISFDGAYTIPYRSYYSKNISNLMMAGRDISASKMAMGSTRVMGTCAVGGQAVGTAAALCIKYDCDPRGAQEHMRELQQMLLKDDAYIPGIWNEDPKDLARRAKVTATSAREGCPPENVINGISRDEDGHRNLWISGKGRTEGEMLTLHLADRQPVSEVHLTFDSNFHYPIKITLSRKRQAQQRIGVPPELIRDYTVTLWQGDKKAAKQTVTENVQRKNIVTFPTTECDRVTVMVHKTNGSNEAHIYEIRVYS